MNSNSSWKTNPVGVPSSSSSPSSTSSLWANTLSKLIPDPQPPAKRTGTSASAKTKIKQDIELFKLGKEKKELQEEKILILHQVEKGMDRADTIQTLNAPFLRDTNNLKAKKIDENCQRVKTMSDECFIKYNN